MMSAFAQPAATRRGSVSHRNVAAESWADTSEHRQRITSSCGAHLFLEGAIWQNLEVLPEVAHLFGLERFEEEGISTTPRAP